MKIGIDIGSTTIKAVVLDDNNNIIYKKYERHLSHITQKTIDLIKEIKNNFVNLTAPRFTLAISGSAGMGLAEKCGVTFVQEVHATRVCVNRLQPDTDAVIELGGEDAKILFIKGIPDARMNGSCAGGTGSFIDQMATLLNVTPDKLNELSEGHEKIYSIASRCGVFAKSDIQPLLNQGVRLNDIAASIFKAVVNQTVAGLAQGRGIEGNVLYLGGPLTFFKELQKSFDETLNLKGVCPENSLYYVSLGAAYSAEEAYDPDKLLEILEVGKDADSFQYMQPLFQNEAEYNEFRNRHSKSNVTRKSYADYINENGENSGIFLGVDAGSTTIKFALIGNDGELLDSCYRSNSGNPVSKVKEYLETLYTNYSDIKITACAVTGYGEDLIKNAFCMDFGIVETAAHFMAAKHIEPQVDFILDIGGQDIKCMKIHNGVIDNIYLNEACSSGCGSFLQTFANALGQDIADFAELGLFANKPVDLGSRCTVFMNSSVKQAQKDGAEKENISAGLSISVVKNAIYKVIRPSSKNELGKHIVVQGGTFYNDAVLRAFEREMNLNVVRPDIAGLMGAYGAALYAKAEWQSRCNDRLQGYESEAKAADASDLKNTASTLLSFKALQGFKHEIRTTNCGLCSNNCNLSVNSFGDGRKFISGNKCERPVTKKDTLNKYNMYEKKLELLKKYMSTPEVLKATHGNEQEDIRVRGASTGFKLETNSETSLKSTFESLESSPDTNSNAKHIIGIPMGLNMFELLPFWYKFWSELGFTVVTSPISDKNVYLKGQSTIPSDTVCYPAKLMHGHITALIDSGVKTIFYPCMSYNIKDDMGDNCFNCPVVAYYPEVINNNMPDIKKVLFIKEYIGIHLKEKVGGKMYKWLKEYFSNNPEITKKNVERAVNTAFDEYHKYMEEVKAAGQSLISEAAKDEKPVIVLAGRPYHIDPEINHGIDSLITGLGAAVISEDAIYSEVFDGNGSAKLSDIISLKVLNQWTYHSRLYAAAQYITRKPEMQMVQLVSFGCGCDAITTDESRRILEAEDKIYTQIKIDEIENLGAAKIRVRSLFAAQEMKRGN